MKNKYYQSRYLRMRQFHRANPWRLEGGLFIPHAYNVADDDPLPYGDSVGFILNGRRVMVTWSHPRACYANKIEDMAYLQADRQETSQCATKQEAGQESTSEAVWQSVGRSRKKVVAYRSSLSAELKLKRDEWHRNAQEALDKLNTTGIDYEIYPAILVRPRLTCMSVLICAPIEARGAAALPVLVDLVKKLLKRETTLEALFPDYRYGKSNWLAERRLNNLP